MYYIAICDDDSNYIKYIKKMLIQSGLKNEEAIFNEYCSGEELIQSMEFCEKIDLLILDMQMKELREEFRLNTISDQHLLEHFKDDNPKDRFSSIMVAGSILGGIQLRNIWRENGKLDGEKEVFPYNEKQIEMIDKYNRLEKTMDSLIEYAEFIYDGEEEEEEEL